MKKQYGYVVIEKVYDEEYRVCYSSVVVLRMFIGEGAVDRAEAYLVALPVYHMSEYSVERVEVG